MFSERMEQEEFAEFYDTHNGFVARIACCILGNERDALDVADQAMWYAFCNPEKFRGAPICAVRSYLAGMARTRSLDMIRRARRNDYTDITNVLDTLYDVSDENVEQAVEMKDFRDAVERCVRSMPDIYRDTLALRIMNEMTFKEISVRLGIPIDTVKSRWRRGIVMIERVVRSRGYGSL